MSRWSFVFLCLFSLGSDGAVVINEIHYHPDVKTEPAEFVELYNSGSDAVDLSGWALSGGIDYTFVAGTVIAPQGYLVVAQNPDFLREKFGVPALGPFQGVLRNSGDQIVLQNAAGEAENEVDYQLGFPWPTVGDPPGYSIELVNPAFDNSLGGNWRRSVNGNAASLAQALIEAGSIWKYFKGTEEASSPTTAWRQPGFDDSSWSAGPTPIGYDPAIPMGTTLSDMAGNYSSVFFRTQFIVTDPTQIAALNLEALYDDGFKVWINGVLVLSQSLPAGEVPFNGLATGPARESAAYDLFSLNSPRDYLVAGTNLIAVQAHNVLLSGSSDFFLDIRLRAQFGNSVNGPTPGARNSVFATNIPPQFRQVEHHPKQPVSGEPVIISAKVTDPDGVAGVSLQYQMVDPGNYIELNDPAYQTSWTTMAMNDSGVNGDALANDAVFSAEIPAPVQAHRRLVRYRITAADTLGNSITVPYADDPQPNFAYFVYDGVPSLRSSLRAGDGLVEYSTNVMRRLPVYHLISKRDSVEHATWLDQYTGQLYKWTGTLVYDGEVYDHIHYRARGGVWRYAMGKNMWKFDFNRGHSFQARDNYRNKYKTDWTKLNLGACIQQGNFLHRGEQGMFESLGFRLFNLVGVEAPKTHFVQFRVIDKPAEADPTNQYAGDFWGLYLAVEQEDGRFLDEHDLPDGNYYKMEAGTGTLNNQGATAAADKSDLDSFISAYTSASTVPTDQWWRDHLDLPRYYSYQTVVQGTHDYDIAQGANYFYFLNPITGQWSIHPWDLDLSWADNMFVAGVEGGNEPFKTRVLTRSQFKLEYQNRVRELRDLLFNSDQTFKLIDEYAGFVRGPAGSPSILDADRAQWDYNPLMTNPAIVNLSKAGQGLFYQAPEAPTKDFAGMVQLMKNYVIYRGGLLDKAVSDPNIPGTPSLSFVGGQSFAANRLTFRASEYNGVAPFQSMKWRLAEVSDTNSPSFDPAEPQKYEINADWQSDELSAFQSEMTIPASAVKVGHTYRARVRVADTQGRWSHWSAALEFQTQEPANAAAVMEDLQVSELMYRPVGGSNFEFVELHNGNAGAALDLGGVKFTQGIDFTFAQGTSIPAGGYLVLVKATNANNFALFRQYYGLTNDEVIVGSYSGSLDNNGETVTLKTAAGGATIISFKYENGNGWPMLPDGVELSLHRISLGQPASDPANWVAGAPTPGRADTASGDSDGDGLPDAWEAAFGLNPHDSADALLDSDQDGLNNLDEFLAGTNPRDPQSSLKLQATAMSGSILIRFNAVAGKSYTLQYRDSLASGVWNTLKVIQAAGSAQIIEVNDSPAAATTARFYRLYVQ